MKALLGGFFALACVVALAGAVSADPGRTDLPEGGVIVPPGEGDPRVPCDMLIRYDDGTDDSPGSGPTLADFGGGSVQYLGVIFSVPAGASYEVQSASWYSDFWVWPGQVNVTAYEISNPANTTTASINVTDGGTWEVEFLTPICVSSDYVVMLCPVQGVWGVVGEDFSAPDNRSYWTSTTCDPVNSAGGVDYMIWSCITPCGGTPTEPTSWGSIKQLYN